MANSYFQFKQFKIIQEKSAMKVGTDGVLLGAWTDVSKASNILDIGSGTGLVSLMLAQRSNANITGIEKDCDAAKESLLNIDNSPWSNRLEIINEDFFKFNFPTLFDIIVCNPPFFKDSLHSPDMKRTSARHGDDFNFHVFFKKCIQLLSNHGILTIVFPFEGSDQLTTIATDLHLHISRKLTVSTTPQKQPKRILLSFSKSEQTLVEEELIIEKYGRHQYSEEFTQLVKDYYLYL